jgi:hypothetical protein
MDRLKVFVSAENVRAVLVTAPVPLDNFSDEALRVIALLMTHCVFNGPVGVNKITSFPVVGEGSINSITGHRWTNSQWRASCKPFAEWVKLEPKLTPLVNSCQQTKIHNDLWPLWDLP